jgi:hypothetical protein
MANLTDYWKNKVGFNVYTQEDPDLLTWLHAQWKDSTSPDTTTDELVSKFVEFSRNLISQRPVIAMEYIDNGIAVVLSTGEKIPFNKSSTIKEVNSSINIMGSSSNMASPRAYPQTDTSVSITGEGR